MTQDERREYLIQYLLKEEIPFGRQNIPTDKQGQENLLRSLMNVRPPRPISNDFLKNCESHSRYFSDELDALFSWMGNKCL